VKDHTGFIMENITEHTNPQEEPAMNEIFYRSIVENQPELICRYLPDGTIIFANTSYCKYFGKSTETLDGIRFADFICPEDRKKEENARKSLNMDNPVSVSEFRVVLNHKHDKIRWQRFSNTAFFDEQGQISEYQSVGRDITDIRRLRRKGRELLEKIDDRMSSLGRVSAGIIHEIRNPISTINIYLAILKRDYADINKEGMTDILDSISASVKRIEKTIARVRDVSRPQPPNLKLADMNQCIRESLALVSPILQQKNIVLETELEETVPVTLLEVRSVSHVIVNLITNSAQSFGKTEQNKIIRICSFHDKDFIFIRISDSGPGIRQEDRDKIFDPFFTSKKNGLGIGLSISYRTIREHGGSVRVTDSPLGGAEFEIAFPMIQAAGVQSSAL